MRRALFVEAWIALAGFRLALWLLPWRVVSRTPPLAASRTSPPVDEVSRAVQAIARYLPAATCLTQALAVRALLARRGHASTLTLGVRNPVGALEAHAWLEAEGRIVLGDPGGVPYERLMPPAR